MTLPRISPADARKLLAEGAALIDIREPDEHARVRIAGARNAPLAGLSRETFTDADRVVVFHCRAGSRTAANTQRLASAAPCDAFILEGGIDAWKAAGLPVVETRGQPIEIMRQVQIVAGSLVVTGVALGALVHPGFFALAGFVGAGLVFAGVSGICTMARVLAHAPWNRRRAAAARA